MCMEIEILDRSPNSSNHLIGGFHVCFLCRIHQSTINEFEACEFRSTYIILKYLGEN
jgi:hypothetical protein